MIEVLPSSLTAARAGAAASRPEISNAGKIRGRWVIIGCLVGVRKIRVRSDRPARRARRWHAFVPLRRHFGQKERRCWPSSNWPVRPDTRRRLPAPGRRASGFGKGLPRRRARARRSGPRPPEGVRAEGRLGRSGRLRPPNEPGPGWPGRWPPGRFDLIFNKPRSRLPGSRRPIWHRRAGRRPAAPTGRAGQRRSH